jgi:hypothetical protein
MQLYRPAAPCNALLRARGLPISFVLYTYLVSRAQGFEIIPPNSSCSPGTMSHRTSVWHVRSCGTTSLGLQSDRMSRAPDAAVLPGNQLPFRRPTAAKGRLTPCSQEGYPGVLLGAAGVDGREAAAQDELALEEAGPATKAKVE